MTNNDYQKIRPDLDETIFRLPKEIVLSIFSYIGIIQQLRLEQVCKAWRSELHFNALYWERLQLDERRNIPPGLFKKLCFLAGPRLRMLRLPMILLGPPIPLDTLSLANCNGLRELDLTKYPLKPELVESIKFCATSVRKLTCSLWQAEQNEVLIELLRVFEKLEELEIYLKIDPDFAYLNPKEFPGLLRLKVIKETKEFTTFDFNSLLSWFPAAEILIENL